MIGPSTIFWLSQIVLSSTKYYCCTGWKQWWCVVAADCMSYMAVPIPEYLQAVILLEAFALNFFTPTPLPKYYRDMYKREIVLLSFS